MLSKYSALQLTIFIFTACSILLTIYVSVDYYIFHNSNNFKPIEEVISITENKEQNFNFEIDFPAWYSIHIKFHRTIDFDSLQNLTGLNIFDKVKNDSSLYFTWLIKDEVQNIIAGDSSMKAPVSISSSNTSISRNLGDVEFKEIGNYSITIKPSVTKDELIKTTPTLYFSCSEHKYRDYHYNVISSSMLSILLFFITAIVVIRNKFKQ